MNISDQDVIYSDHRFLVLKNRSGIITAFDKEVGEDPVVSGARSKEEVMRSLDSYIQTGEPQVIVGDF